MNLNTFHRPGDGCGRQPRPLRPGFRALWPLTIVIAATPTPPASQSQINFIDASEIAGIAFKHSNGASGDKHLPETMGAGAGWIDFDGDGRLDLYLVDSGRLPATGSADSEGAAQAALRSARDADHREAGDDGRNLLYRGVGEGVFTIAATAAADDDGYGMGVTAADYDNDGWLDLYVTNFGPNVLLRNNGDGSFSRVENAATGDNRWSASAVWSDLDADGWLDLYVTNYIAYDIANARYCEEPLRDTRSYCHIDLFDGVADQLFHNNGDSDFEDVSAAAGVVNAAEDKGLGVVTGDLNDDGRIDMYVANDTAQNFLYVHTAVARPRNQAGGESDPDGSHALGFEDIGLFSGTGYSEDGKAQAGMGTNAADLDGDGSLEILVTNFAFEPNNLFRRITPGAYVDDTYALGLGEASLPTLGFGITAADFDGDGDTDVAVANGHILDNVAELKDNATYAQSNHLFTNQLTDLRRAALREGQTIAPAALSRGFSTASAAWRPTRELLVETGADAGPGFALSEVSRGLAAGDADGDGDPDLVVTNSAGRARYLRNDSTSAQPPNQRAVLRLRGRGSSRDALGAVVIVTPLGGDPDSDGAAGSGQRRDVRSASSYCSQDSMDLYIGLGKSRRARVEIRWLDGRVETINAINAGQLTLIVEGRGAIATAALRPSS